MKLQRRSLTVMIGTMALVLTIVTLLSVSIFFRVASSTEENQFFLITSIVKSRLGLTESKAQQVGEMVADMPVVRTTFAARQRTDLQAALSDLYDVQNEKYGIENIHFVVPPSTSFLRMRSPEVFGDDLSYKPQVLEAAKQGLMKRGETINRTGPVIYSVVPVRDTTDSLVGCVEIGIGIGPNLDKLKSDHGLESALIVVEKQLKEVATEVGSDVINESNRVGDCYKYHSTNWELMRNLVAADDVAASATATTTYVRSYGDISYGVVLLPLTNYQGELIGYVAAASDFSASRSAVSRTVLLLVAGAIICFLLLAGVVMVIIRGGVVRPLKMLGDHYGALAAGENPSEMEDTSKYFEEIQALAAHYETLRKAAESKTSPTEE